MAAILRHAGKVEITPHILAAKHMKPVVNSMTLGTIAMTGGELSDRQPEGMQELMMWLGSESLKVGEALGRPIVPIFGLTTAEIEGSNDLHMKLVDKGFARGRRGHRHHRDRRLRRAAADGLSASRSAPTQAGRRSWLPRSFLQ